ncbi:hypothetical protein [Bdellovibrio sp. HCB274]|uniref:hypothetical protein n=1 Tax=Bdellovibrio sp. HCB274 TaxID=3394361 RepID=UPI0039B4D440
MSKAASKNPFTFWKIDPEELKHQVENYDTLPFSKSSHKVSAGIFVGCGTLTAIAAYFGVLQSFSFIDAAIFVGLSWFIYEGKKWAIISAIVFWTLAKVQMIATGANAGTQVVFWFLFMKPLYMAYRVNKARGELTKPPEGTSSAA